MSDAPAEDCDDAEASLRPVGGVADIQVIGALPDRVIELLALRTAARSVWIHQDTVHHIVTQRGGDSEFVLEHLPQAVLRPQLAGLELSDPSRVRLVYYVDGNACYLHVSLKVVAAIESNSSHDELWVSTAYRMGTRSLTRLSNKATLWRVNS